jgi:V/A-type H+-transporting ATPase subunit K
MDPIFFAWAGAALAIGVSNIASSYGTVITGNAAVGAMKKNPDAFGNYLILCALPGTNGLYGFLGYFLLRGFITPELTWFQGIAIFFAGLMLGFVNLFASLRQGNICANAIAAIGSGHDVFGKAIILAAFPELYAIIAVAGTFMISIAL